MKKILFIPDAHVPFHDKRAVKLMYRVAKDFKPDVIAVLGDYADFYSVSSHSKDPNRAHLLEKEVKAVNSELDSLDALGAKQKIFISGNHEDRLERYLADKAPELFNVVRVEKLFNLKKRKWTYVPYKSDYQLGKLNLTHDVGTAGRSAAYRALDTYQHNIATGHTHRISYIVEGNARGKAHVSVSFGWLGDKAKADYMHKVKANRDWSLGFGIGYLHEKAGNVYVTPVPIVGYTCVVNGVYYVG